MGEEVLTILPLLAGYGLDLLFGDPESMPHPVRLFGNLIYGFEKWLNAGRYQFLKGMFTTVVLCTATYFLFSLVLYFQLMVHPVLYILFSTLFAFYGLANKSLIREGELVFAALRSGGLEAGRKQLARIVGRDTSRLDAQQIRIAVLETMSENLSDGVVAPLFFYALGGVPGMMTYKMINTLDSMIGYRSERFEQFGKFAARLDDVVNFIPARLTALLMCLVSASPRGCIFLFRYGRHHKSPNAGYPESALAGILDVRFGGPNTYHGVLVSKPHIGSNTRPVTDHDFLKTRQVNHLTCLVMVVVIVLFFLF